MDSEFQVLIDAILDSNTGKDVSAQLDDIRDLAVRIEHANIEESALKEIQKTLDKNGFKINIDAGDLGISKASASDLQKQGAAIGQTVGTSISSEIKSKLQSQLSGLKKQIESTLSGIKLNNKTLDGIIPSYYLNRSDVSDSVRKEVKDLVSDLKDLVT